MPMKAEAENTTHRTSLIARLGKRVAGDQEGGTAIEYALIAAGIGAAVAATVYSLGTSTAGFYQTIANLLRSDRSVLTSSLSKRGEQQAFGKRHMQEVDKQAVK